uniref:AAA domain-containing protein n=1 Tax=Mesocestoides corti TaxID=53468 RepID=A0A5K3FPH5_MESCO
NLYFRNATDVDVRPTCLEQNSDVAISSDQRLWTERYSASCLDEMVLNSSDLPAFVSWLKAWDSKIADVCDGDQRSRKKKRDAVYFPSSDDSCDSNSSGSDNSWRCSAYLILGPIGCGKTSLVYALATQYGYKVICSVYLFKRCLHMITWTLFLG